MSLSIEMKRRDIATKQSMKVSILGLLDILNLLRCHAKNGLNRSPQGRSTSDSVESLVGRATCRVLRGHDEGVAFLLKNAAMLARHRFGVNFK
jgi:hypothetical protein